MLMFLFSQAESQLVTVGTNVKNFFSELDIIGDALPQSSVDKKQGAAPDSFMVRKTDDVLGIKSPVGIDGGRDDGVHIGSVESVKSISSGLLMEEIDDGIETKKFQLQTSDKKDSGNANQEIGLDSEAKFLIPASDDVGGCYSFMETEDRSRDLVDMSSKIADDTLLPDVFNMEILCKKSAAGIEPCPADTSAISGLSNCKYFMVKQKKQNLLFLLVMHSLTFCVAIGNGAANLTTSATEPEGLELYDSSDESEATTPLPESGNSSFHRFFFNIFMHYIASS